jgi:hypothetical protein
VHAQHVDVGLVAARTHVQTRHVDVDVVLVGVMHVAVVLGLGGRIDGGV